MAVQPIVPGVYPIPLGFVNAFLILTDHLTLIDTGVPGSAEAILETVRDLGRRPSDVRHILVTHCHRDHAGSLAAVKQATGARVYMHRADAALVRTGRAMRTFRPAPGLINALLFKMFIPRGTLGIERVEIDEDVQDAEELAAARGIRAIHAPGHSAG
ncbi:MAG: MBL fold metallo-hydrolase, partial [Pseudomonadota bacterium]